MDSQTTAITIDAPVETVMVSQASSVSPPPPAPSGNSESASPSLTMPDRNTDWDAYKSKFESLSFEERLAVEQGKYEVEKKEEPVVAPKVVDRLPGDKPVDEKPVELGIDPEEIEKFDPRIKATIKAMQSDIDRLATFDGLEQDPVIQRRLEELKNGKPFKPSEEIKSSFDPNKLVTAQDIEALGIDGSPESLQAISNLLAKAHAAGIDESFTHAENKAENGIVELRRLNETENQLSALMSKQGIVTKLPFSHEAHPLREFIDWSADSGVSNEFLDKLGPVAQEAMYATFLAAKGKLDQAMKNVATTTRLNYIRTLQNAKNEVRTMGKTEKTTTEPVNAFGVDTDRYLTDQVYRRSTFNNANPEMRKKLEVLATTGKFQ